MTKFSVQESGSVSYCLEGAHQDGGGGGGGGGGQVRSEGPVENGSSSDRESGNGAVKVAAASAKSNGSSNGTNNNNNSQKMTKKGGKQNGKTVVTSNEIPGSDQDTAMDQVNGGGSSSSSNASTASANGNNNEEEEANGEGAGGSDGDGKEGGKDKDPPIVVAEDVYYVHDSGLTIKIIAPAAEPFEIQVSSTEIVQELHQLLMEREDTCHRTCFSLQLDGNTLDNFAELKSIPGLKDGSIIKVVEEPYTCRESRIHVKHVRDLLKPSDWADAYAGTDCASLSFLNAVSGGELSGKKRVVDCTPPDYIMPGGGTTTAGVTTINPLLLSPLHPLNKDQKPISCLKVRFLQINLYHIAPSFDEKLMMTNDKCALILFRFSPLLAGILLPATESCTEI